MATRLEILKMLVQLAPATAFVAVVFLGTEILIRLGGVCFEVQETNLHLTEMLSVIGLRVGDG